jgi:hypothetical protein
MQVVLLSFLAFWLVLLSHGHTHTCKLYRYAVAAAYAAMGRAEVPRAQERASQLARLTAEVSRSAEAASAAATRLTETPDNEVALRCAKEAIANLMEATARMNELKADFDKSQAERVANHANRSAAEATRMIEGGRGGAEAGGGGGGGAGDSYDMGRVVCSFE